MWKRSREWVISLLVISCFAILSLSQTFASLPLVTTTQPAVKQDLNAYLPKEANKPLLTQKQQATLTAQFLEDYFSVWKNPSDTKGVVDDQRQILADIRRSELFLFNFHPMTEDWIDAAEENENLKNLRSLNRNAIVVSNTYLRALPTEQPLFQSSKIAGQGYPFDTLQISALWTGTPVKILHFSRDNRWALIQTYNADGWVLVSSLGFVDKKFIDAYTKKSLVAIIKDKVSISASDSFTVIESRIGMLFPKIGSKVMIPILDAKHNAILVAAKIDKSTYSPFPLVYTPKNLAKLMQQLLGEPYGWGGFQYFRDCSLSVMDLFLPFGIGMPRNSQAQLTENKYYDLEDLTSVDKLKFIKRHAKPFLTLLGTEGHIVIYLGEKAGVPYVFQTVWGAHTQNDLDENGRAVLGQAAVTPLNFGANIPNVEYTLLDRLTKMTSAAE